MCKVIAIANQKGGVAKTTTAISLTSGLKIKGYKVLLIDTDSQGNASDTFRANKSNTLYNLLVEGVPAKSVIQHFPYGDIIASDRKLVNADKLLERIGKDYILKKALASTKNEYDYIIIDTPPTLGVLLINALTFADEVIVPITADGYGLQGLQQLCESIDATKEYTNPNLHVAGLLLAKYNNRTLLSKNIYNEMPSIAKMLDTIIFKCTIRECTAVKESQTMKRCLYDYAPNCTSANDYLNLINELIERGI